MSSPCALRLVSTMHADADDAKSMKMDMEHDVHVT